MTEGCPERLDWSFLHYVAAFRRVQRPKVVARLAGVVGRVVQLESRRAVREFAARL